ncbi:hypothetical protein Tco_0191341 [Tanacetum coccineum]
MTTLKFADTHNMVAFLSKPAKSEGFEQIVDFLNAHIIKYALTVNPTIYTSCIEQFWATVKAKTVNGEVQLQALVDGKEIIITESIVRRDLQLEDAEGVDCLPNATIFEHLTLMGMVKNLENVSGIFLMYPRSRRPKRKDTQVPQSSVPSDNVVDEAINEEMDDSLVRATTTASSLEAEQDSGGPRRQDTMRDTIAQTRFENVSKTSNDSLLAGVNTPRSDKDSMKLKELMEFYTKLQQRVLDLENTKTAQAQEITSLKLRVKKLEKKGGSRTHKLKRLYKVGRSARVIFSDEASLGDQEDASKHRRKIDDIDKDAEITLVDETQGGYGDDLMFDTSVLDDEEVFAGQDMAEKEINVAEKEVSTVDPVTTAGEVVTTASVKISTASPPKTIADDLTLTQTLIEIKSAKPKVKGVVIGEQSESTTRTRPQQLPSKYKAQMQAELEEEDRLVRQREEEANIISWDNVQAMIDADYQMAQQMQAESSSMQAERTRKVEFEEKSKLFGTTLRSKGRKKHLQP